MEIPWIENSKKNENIEDKKSIKTEIYNMDKEILNGSDEDNKKISQDKVNMNDNEKYEIDKFWIRIL